MPTIPVKVPFPTDSLPVGQANRKAASLLIQHIKVLASANFTVETTDYTFLTFPSNAKFAEASVLTTATRQMRINKLAEKVHSLQIKLQNT